MNKLPEGFDYATSIDYLTSIVKNKETAEDALHNSVVSVLRLNPSKLSHRGFLKTANLHAALYQKARRKGFYSQFNAGPDALESVPGKDQDHSFIELRSISKWAEKNLPKKQRLVFRAFLDNSEESERQAAELLGMNYETYRAQLRLVLIKIRKQFK